MSIKDSPDYNRAKKRAIHSWIGDLILGHQGLKHLCCLQATFLWFYCFVMHENLIHQQILTAHESARLSSKHLLVSLIAAEI